MECVIYRGFLHKTPPLDKLIVTWKKRWFVLLQRDPFNPRSAELNYYMDSNQEDKRGSINLTGITRINSSSSKGRGHIFSIELNSKKIMLKAEDAQTKCIWIAKLYEFAGQGHNYHVSIPNQPCSGFCEGLLQLSKSTHQLVIVPPTASFPILNIPFSQIRRFGYKVMLDNYDVLWFELCRECREREQEFCFCVVTSGLDRAVLIANDLKTKIESSTGKFMILEEDKHPECTFISRLHYGCPPYPKAGRDRILHSGLVNMEATKMVSYTGKRRASESPAHAPVATDRRNTVMTLLGHPLPPSHTPTSSPSHSPTPLGGTSLQHLTPRHSLSPGSTSDPLAHSGGVTLGAFERGYLTMSDSATLLSGWKNKRTLSTDQTRTLDRVRSPRSALGDLPNTHFSRMNGSHDNLLFPSSDSGSNTSTDVALNHNGRGYVASPKRKNCNDVSGYDHLEPPPLLPPSPPSSASSSASSSSACPPIPLRSNPSPPSPPSPPSSSSSSCPPIPPRSNVSLANGRAESPYIDA